MKQGSGYRTKQKEQVLHYLEAHAGQHVTAQEISRHLSDSGKPVGTATIYRCLDHLVSEGIVRKYTIDSRTGACYEYTPDSGECRHHFHLKCMQCDKLYHVACEALSGVNHHVLEHHGFAIDHSKTVLYGICQSCREAQA